MASVQTAESRVNYKYMEKEEPKRTETQHRSLFLWFGQIERVAEDNGVTWDMIIRHTHGLRITKENLHGMCKQLQHGLWGTISTKQLKKQKQIDIIIDHFVSLFAKEGLELPPFPSKCERCEHIECVCEE